MAGKSTEYSVYWREISRFQVTMDSAYSGLRNEKELVPRMDPPTSTDGGAIFNLVGGHGRNPNLGEKTCFCTC